VAILDPARRALARLRLPSGDILRRTLVILRLAPGDRIGRRLARLARPARARVQLRAALLLLRMEAPHDRCSSGGTRLRRMPDRRPLPRNARPGGFVPLEAAAPRARLRAWGRFSQISIGPARPSGASSPADASWQRSWERPATSGGHGTAGGSSAGSREIPGSCARN